MKLLLLNPLLPKHFSRGNPLPMGFLALDAWLTRHGHQVEIVLPQYKLWTEQRILERIEAAQPDMVGMGGFFDWLDDAARISAMLRERMPGVLQVFGGNMASPNPELCFQLAPIDFVCRGEGEIAMQKLLDALDGGGSTRDIPGICYMDGGEFVDMGMGEPVPMEEVPLFDYEKVNIAHHAYNIEKNPMTPYYAPIGQFMTGRGCPYNCNFCFSIQKFRREATDSLLRRLDHYVDYLHPKTVCFYDDTFCFSERWVVDFCEQLKAKQYGFQFTCTGRPNVFTPRMAKALKEAGCYRVHFALEVADDAVLRSMNKKITVEQWQQAVAVAKDAGIMPNISAMSGQPGEDWEVFSRTAELILNVQDEQYPWANIGFFVLRIYPGSPLYRQALDAGYFADDMEFYTNFFKNNPIWLCDLPRPVVGRYVQQVNEMVAKLACKYMAGYPRNGPVRVFADSERLTIENVL
jgi:radical SAM superfamily enzyme YgiQ (UPF0313 family)